MTSKTRSLIGALAASAGVAFAAPAHSAFLSNFEGWSVFGTVCSLCDATVSFAVYQNADSNWTDDTPFSGRSLTSLLSPTTDSAAKYVYLYQVVNTNPVGSSTNPPEDALQDFNIFTGPAGSANPFSSGGAIPGTVFQGASTAVTPVDTANDGVPSAIATVTPLVSANGATNSPNTMTFGGISNPGINLGNPGQGIRVAWNTNNEIPVGGTSSLIYLTSNLKPSFTWAETQSEGGSGAPGDVPAAIPEPGTWALLGLGMAGLLGWGGRRRKNAA